MSNDKNNDNYQAAINIPKELLPANLGPAAWTAEEDQILKDRYASEGARNLVSLLPGRSIRAINNRAELLGLPSPSCKRTDCWSEHDLNVLKEHYSELGVKGVLPLLEKKYSPVAIHNMAYKLGLRRNSCYYSYWSEHDLKILTQEYPILGAEGVQPLLESKRSLTGISTKAHQLGLTLLPECRANVWSRHDLNILTEKYKELGAEGVQPLLDKERPLYAIMSMACKLGLCVSAVFSDDWSQHDLEVLAEKYDELGLEEIQPLLEQSRTLTEIATKAADMGLSMVSRTRSDSWSARDLALMKEQYVKLGPDGIQPLLEEERSLRAITSKAYILGLRQEARQPWTEHDLNILRENYGQLGPKGVQPLLAFHRSPGTITGKANEMGLRLEKYNSWSEHDVNVLKKNYSRLGVNGVLPLLEKPRSLSAIVSMAYRLNLKREHGNSHTNFTDINKETES